MKTLISIALLIFLLWLVLRKSSPRKLVIESPRLGMVNLMGDSAARLLDEDRRALAPLFGSPVEAQGGVLNCDVLFIYCEMDSGGEADNSPVSLQKIIQSSGAKIAIIASENGEEKYRAIAERSHEVNLVMTLERKGATFSRFFTRLFSEMFKGKSMPVAWNELAPQIPGHEHAECPETYCVMGAGQLAFK